MLSFIFCVVRYKGDWTKAYHYAAVLLAESRWSKVKTFDIYHALAHSFLLLDPVSRETLTSVPFSFLQTTYMYLKASFRVMARLTNQQIAKEDDEGEKDTEEYMFRFSTTSDRPTLGC